MNSKSGESQRRKKQYRGIKIRITTDFLSETMQARKQWRKIFKSLREKNYQARILYPVKMSFKNRLFSGKQKLREVIFNISALQQRLRVLFKQNMIVHRNLGLNKERKISRNV